MFLMRVLKRIRRLESILVAAQWLTYSGICVQLLQSSSTAESQTMPAEVCLILQCAWLKGPQQLYVRRFHY